MKKGIIFLIVILSLTSCSTVKYTTYKLPEETSRTVKTTYDQDKNFAKANEWLATTFINAKSVIQYSDKEEGVIVGRYLMFEKKYITDGVYSDEFYANIIIHVSDNKVCITIKNQPSVDTPHNPQFIEQSGPTISDISKSIQSILIRFESEINVDRSCE